MKHNIKCPACGEQIELNGETGEVIGHGKAKKSANLDDALKSLKKQEAGRWEMFQKSKEDEKNKSERLGKLFSKEEKRVREEKDSDPYVRDIDLD